MVTRSERLDDFVTAQVPQPGMHVTVLAEDHVGTYTLPFACEYTGDSWRNAATGEAVQTNVIGWRAILLLNSSD
jgi:hypothetical protein